MKPFNSRDKNIHSRENEDSTQETKFFLYEK